MKVLLLGGHGLLGTAFRDTAPSDVSVAAPTRREVDVTDARAVSGALDTAAPTWVIDCAAFTGVDAAESAEDAAAAVNAAAVGRLGALAAARGARVLLPSTDYVFDGALARPYREDDTPRPLSAYGRTKLAGEDALRTGGARHLVVRSGWLYGRGGKNFPATMWRRARAHAAAAVVDDQVGAPTSANDLARWCWTLLARGADGVYHAANAGTTTWCEVARTVYAAAGWPEGVTATTSAAHAAPAPRPRYSVLDCAKFDALVPDTRRSWREALAEYLGTLAAERAA